ncbi:hypothetical protein E2562_008041 [Oryza meyeriana var. granulata]|uniref:Uncharacterized protein n=1 Tax=Oryza meyeriana var. granulata TaxID=110450 RepID=A0A6G1DFT3_9ORYZ|nr:hypothetical protein E2562_008041 [Oryza meyeriana var. granulata]
MVPQNAGAGDETYGSESPASLECSNLVLTGSSVLRLLLLLSLLAKNIIVLLRIQKEGSLRFGVVTVGNIIPGSPSA